jgi:hypothetical protein
VKAGEAGFCGVFAGGGKIAGGCLTAKRVSAYYLNVGGKKVFAGVFTR